MQYWHWFTQCARCQTNRVMEGNTSLYLVHRILSGVVAVRWTQTRLHCLARIASTEALTVWSCLHSRSLRESAEHRVLLGRRIEYKCIISPLLNRCCFQRKPWQYQKHLRPPFADIPGHYGLAWRQGGREPPATKQFNPSRPSLHSIINNVIVRVIWWHVFHPEAEV